LSSSVITNAEPVSAPPVSVPETRRAPVRAMDIPPSVRGIYAKAGAVQRGWSLYVGETELVMPFPCDKCKRAGAICSGLEGQRCGRCRAIRKPCSHNFQPRSLRSKSDPPLRVKLAATASACGPDEDESLEEPDRQPESEKMAPGNVLETSSVPLPQTPSSRASNDSLAESQDEDDKVVEELMDREGGEEENVAVETICFADAQGDTGGSTIVGSQGSPAAFVISQDAIPDHTFTRHDDSIQDSPHGDVHADTPIASVCKVTDVDISTRVPTTTVGNETLPQSVTLSRSVVTTVPQDDGTLPQRTLTTARSRIPLAVLLQTAARKCACVPQTALQREEDCLAPPGSCQSQASSLGGL